MDSRLLKLLCWAFLLWIVQSAYAHAQTTSTTTWQQNFWQRLCSSLDMDFYNDRYYINSNSTCDGTTGTFYTAGSGNTGLQNFITGTGSAFTRAGTTNVTDTNPPFYLNTSTQAFVSRASVTNNVTAYAAPFFIGTTGNGPSQSFVSRASSGTYFDSTGTLQTKTSGSGATAQRAPAYYYNGSAWVLGGTLIESTTTNSIRNNTMVGAVAGTPGTMPTDWGISSTTTGLSTSVIGTGTENGIKYIDIQCSGTATASGQIQIYLETGSGIAATIGQTWTASVYVKLSAGSASGISSSNIFLNENSSSGSYITGQVFVFTLGSSALGTTRASGTRTLTNTNTGYVQPYLQFFVNNGAAVNFTVRIGMPQMEQGSTATSVISTSSAAVTRSADIYNQQPASYFDGTGTLYFAPANTARDNHNPTSPYADQGTVIEPAATNSTTNNMMVGAVPADGIERTNNGTFSTTSPNVCSGSVTSGSNTLSCNNGTGAGWVGSINSGTGTVTATSGNMTLTGDGTNAASIYEAITTVSGYAYTIAVTVGSGSSVTVQAGTTVGGTNLSTAKTANAGTTTSFQFTATGSTTYIQVNNTSATSATLTAVSMQSAGQLPTGWNLSGSPFAYNGGIVITLVNSGTASGISFFDLQFKGTPAATSFINLQSGLITATNGQTWDDSSFLAIVGGSTANILRLTMNTAVYASGSSYLSELFSAVSYTSASSTMTRYSSTGTISNSSAASIGPYYQLSYTNGLPVNITVRIGMPQMEQSSYSTSAIPTFGSAVTRTADVYSVPNGGTYFNGSGVLTQAGVNVPRLDHNPASPYSPLGILIEEGRTNLVPNSSGTTGETAVNGTTYTASSVLAPDNSTYFNACTEGSGSTGDQACRWNFTGTASTTYTASAFVKANTISVFTLVAYDNGITSSWTVNLTSGTITACGTGLGGSQGIQNIGNGVYRVWTSFTTGTTPTGDYFDFRLADINNPSCIGEGITGNGTSNMYIWGVQLEAGANPTSYIPTSGSSVTRAQDLFTVPGTAGGGSGWLTNNVGTLGTVGSIPSLSGNSQGFAGIDNGTASQSVLTQVGSSGNRSGVFYNSGQTYIGTVSGYTLGTPTKIVLAFSPSYENGAADNTAFSTSGTTAPPATQSRLTIGHTRNASGDLDGWVSRIWYMPITEADYTLPNFTQ